MSITRIFEWLELRRSRIVHIAAAVLTPVLFASSFPPFDVPEAAFVALIPMLVWFRFEPSFRAVAITSFGLAWVAWMALLIWLRHVTVVGTILVSGLVALHFVLWALGSAWLTRKCVDKGIWSGLVIAVGTAAFWVVTEQIRSWVFTGFPWLPFAASQWSRPIMLQSAAYLGAWGVSFALVFLNAGIAGYLIRLVEYARTRTRKLCPEFYAALLVFVSFTFLLTNEMSDQRREKLFKAGVVQPAVPQNQKWDLAFTTEILSRIETTSGWAAAMKPDIVFWPESVLPFALNYDPQLEAWTERLVNVLEAPVMTGALAVEESSGEEIWRNSVFLIRPELGAYPKYYSKRHLVPFGEYIPLRRFWPWMTKFVPLDGDFLPGEEPMILPLNMPGRTINVGPLICYEDVFPAYARASTLNGAAVLFVATNSAWYGQGGASLQHMAHSVLRAVENRRVVIRVGNDGWTCWIDEYGNVRDELLDDAGSIYFNGATAWEIDRDRRWVGKKSAYVANGDWFAWACYGLSIMTGAIAWAMNRERKSIV